MMEIEPKIPYDLDDMLDPKDSMTMDSFKMTLNSKLISQRETLKIGSRSKKCIRTMLLSTITLC